MPDSLTTRCSACDLEPAEPLHRKLTGTRSQCRQSAHWKLATFDHAKFFRREGEHKATCTTCHVVNDSSLYPCFGGHEHQPNEIRAKHLEAVITRFDHCVECHRSAEDGESNEHERERSRRWRN